MFYVSRCSNETVRRSEINRKGRYLQTGVCASRGVSFGLYNHCQISYLNDTKYGND